MAEALRKPLTRCAHHDARIIWIGAVGIAAHSLAGVLDPFFCSCYKLY
jgi:hypothetical protein